MPKKKDKDKKKTDILSTPEAVKQRAEGIAAATPTTTQQPLVSRPARGTLTERVTTSPPVNAAGEVIPRQSAAQRIFEQEVAAGRAVPSGQIDPSTGKVLAPGEPFTRTDFGTVPGGATVDIAGQTVTSAEGQVLTPEEARELAISQGIAKQLEQQEKGAELFAEQKVAARTPMEIAESAAAEGTGLTLGREIPGPQVTPEGVKFEIIPEAEGLWTWPRLLQMGSVSLGAATLTTALTAKGIGPLAIFAGIGAFFSTLGVQYVSIKKDEYNQIRDKSDRARTIIEKVYPQFITSANLGTNRAEIYRARAEAFDFLRERQAELARTIQTASDEDLSNAQDEWDEIDRYFQWSVPVLDAQLEQALNNPNLEAAAMTLQLEGTKPQDISPKGGISGFFKKMGV